MSDECLEYYARENYRLNKIINEAKEALDNIKMKLICIGGPLNDNVHGYTKEQLTIFYRIEDEIDCLEIMERPND